MAGDPLRLSGLRQIKNAFSDRLVEDAPLARYTASRVGGKAQAFLEARTREDLIKAASLAWNSKVPFVILGGGSNILISDKGVSGLVVLNRAQRVQFLEQKKPPQVWAESGANLGLIARKAALKGLSGLEWAGGIPGTLGGAVTGNAGAHGGDMAGYLLLVEVLHRGNEGNGSTVQREKWPTSRMDYSYRSSLIKRHPGFTVVLSAWLRLERSTPRDVLDKMDGFTAFRRRTQPPGASMGSMFKNPPGDFAGRLIEAVGLKGARLGGAQISTVHANFFINQGTATASDIFGLIQLARQQVSEKFGVELELEIDLVGDW